MKQKKTGSSSHPTGVQFKLGIFFIFLSFLGMAVVIVLIFGKLKVRDEEVSLLKAQVSLAEETKAEAEETNIKLLDALGSEVSVSRVVREADKVYDEKVKDAKDGYLWVDRTAPNWVVTLGALNGLSEGSRLSVFDGNEKIDTVKVMMAMDVISYVVPTERLKNQYNADYFRVVKE
ncbi:MAG TPA: hypothetical protein PLT76_03595 [Candidatus Omnitrophota bacterium]|nr:hypothetical protein [Candidatus Omnitrophota bacterium]HPB67371.1 hypothetical protein [Candidatus Omnitrophota bacterium]HQO57786.1 hypothetical protein [Candidatus Omnitrophota bacterium]HQP13062.1 hypothetical protein [Candidatus Omnitrophota bacterium]